MTSFVFPHNAQWETVHTENKIRSSSLLWKTESPLISQRRFPHKIGNGSMSTGSATLKRLRCEALATPGGNKYQLQPTTSRICGKMIENVPASSFIYLQIFRNIYILIKTSVHRCSSSNRKHPLISLVIFIVFVFPLLLIKWTSFDHKMAQKPQPVTAHNFCITICRASVNNPDVFLKISIINVIHIAWPINVF